MRSNELKTENVVITVKFINVCSGWWSGGQFGIVKYDSIYSRRLIKHTKKLMEKEEKLCIKILQTLREMLDRKETLEEKVSVMKTFP